MKWDKDDRALWSQTKTGEEASRLMEACCMHFLIWPSLRVEGAGWACCENWSKLVHVSALWGPRGRVFCSPRLSDSSPLPQWEGKHCEFLLRIRCAESMSMRKQDIHTTPHCPVFIVCCWFLFLVRFVACDAIASLARREKWHDCSGTPM